MRKIFLILSLFAVLTFSGLAAYAEPKIRPPETLEESCELPQTQAFFEKFAPRKNDLLEIVESPLFKTILDLINKEYVDGSPNKEKMLEGAINGMLKTLDPHSVYHNPEEYKELKEEMSGEIEGIGARLKEENKSIIAFEVFKDSPAQKAGLEAGDIIVKVANNGNETLAAGKTLNEIVKEIRGKRGTKVILTVVRKGAPEPIQIEIVRNTVIIVSVEAKKIGDIGYVKLRVFGDKSLSEMKNALEKMKQDGAKKIIIDLRDNLGGRFDITMDIASLLLPKRKIIVSVKERVNNEIYFSEGGDFTDMPLVILTNAYSASASEILAAAVKENGRGKVIGTKTYGKGSVQRIIPLSNGGALRLTIAKFYSPNGNEIHGKGVAPDIEVEINSPAGGAENFKMGEPEKDPQLRKAIEILK